MILHLGKALLCIAGQCHPVLVGEQTPVGTFPVIEQRMPDGQHVLAFARTQGGSVYAIHLAPSARRRQLLATDNRTGVTAGCINVSNSVFTEARRHNRLEIRP